MSKQILALGGFDGVHLGHQQVLTHASRLADALDAVLTVLTFDPLPAQLIHPDFTYVLTPLWEKIDLLLELGVKSVRVLRFETGLQTMGPQEFIKRYILDAAPVAVVAGHDHRFGSRGAGDIDLLRQALARAGTRVEVVPELKYLDAPVRSTRIRERLLLGDVGRAAELLGREYRVSGQVAAGTGTGRNLGFPTLNLLVTAREKLIPADGVYAVRLDIEGQLHPAVLNIGHRPTFCGEARTIETHIIGRRLVSPPSAARATFVERLRPERGFPSPQELACQIGRDIDQARALLLKGD